VLVRFRHVAIAAAPVVLLAAALTGLALTSTAQAQPASGSAARHFDGLQCQSRSGGHASCGFAQQVTLPMSVSVTASASPEGADASVSWTISCSVNGGNAASTSGDKTAATPFTTALALPKSSSGGCTVNATISLQGTANLTAGLNYSVANQVTIWVPSGNTRPGAPLANLKCVTAARNSAGSKAVLGDCPATYATAWVHSGNKLIHHNLCLTDPHDGGGWTKLVLERCTGASDQAWTFTKGRQGYPEVVLKSNGSLCLDDTNYTEKNGTPLIVLGCNSSDAQRWSIS
jgi:ricin-type beta-trefoil lectin protein